MNFSLSLSVSFLSSLIHSASLIIFLILRFVCSWHSLINCIIMGRVTMLCPGCFIFCWASMVVNWLFTISCTRLGLFDYKKRINKKNSTEINYNTEIAIMIISSEMNDNWTKWVNWSYTHIELHTHRATHTSSYTHIELHTQNGHIYVYTSVPQKWTSVRQGAL